MQARSLWPGLPAVVGEAGPTQRFEIKVRVAPEHGERAARALGGTSGEAAVRRVYFLDTLGLALDNHGVVLRIRDKVGSAADAVVKIRAPSRPQDTGPRGRCADVEVDMLPDRVDWSTSLKRRLGSSDVSETLCGRRELPSLFSQDQLALVHQTAPQVDPEHLLCLGPVLALRRRVSGATADPTWIESWRYPDGSRITEILTKCSPERAQSVATCLSAVLAGHSVQPADVQQTKAHSTVAFFAARPDAAHGA
jgi:hypothetical protein